MTHATKEVIYFGAKVSGVRVIWVGQDRCQCVCECGRLFYAYRSCLSRTHARGGRSSCAFCRSARLSLRNVERWASL